MANLQDPPQYLLCVKYVNIIYIYLVSYLRGKCSTDPPSPLISSVVFLLDSPPRSTRPRPVFQAQCSCRGWRRLAASLQVSVSRRTQVETTSPTRIPGAERRYLQ